MSEPWDSPKAISTMRDARLPMRQQLEEQLKYHQGQVIKIQEAIALLQRNPDIERITDLMAEIR